MNKTKLDELNEFWWNLKGEYSILATILMEVGMRDLNWINLKLRQLKWTKAKLENWNEFWWNLKDEYSILVKILMEVEWKILIE